MSLEPGGFLQWGETDVPSFRVEKTSPENSGEALTYLFNLSQSRDPRLKPNWVASLPRMLLESGLEDVESDIKDAPPHLALASHECNLLIHNIFMKKAQDQELVSELEELLDKVARETRQGACWAFTRWTVIGRKPKA